MQKINDVITNFNMVEVNLKISITAIFYNRRIVLLAPRIKNVVKSDTTFNHAQNDNKKD